MGRVLDVLVVDDEPHAVRRLCLLCDRLDGIRVVGTATDGLEGLRMLEALRPDVVLLDVAMPGLDGMAVARAAGNAATPPAIVFVTAHNRFAVEAFDLAAADYLLKPVALDRLDRALRRFPSTPLLPAAPAQPRPAPDLWIPRNGNLVRIPVSTLDLVEAERDYVRLHVGTRSFLMSGTITELEHRLEPDLFVRVHRSWIVRWSLVSSMERAPASGWSIILPDGRPIPVGRTFLSRLRPLRQASPGTA